MGARTSASLRRAAGLVLASLAALVSDGSHAQVLQSWSHSAPFGDASGAVAVDDNLMFVNNNEDAVLRLYVRYPNTACRAPIYSLNVKSNLNFTGSDPTADLESAVKLVDANGTRIYWLGSLGNSTNGNLRPNRSRIFATQVLGDGTGSPPYTLSYIGRYDRLRDDVIAWDVNNLHGLGANYFGLAASAASGVSPKGVNGFNVEGLTLGPNGTTAFIGCRTPLVNSAGPTTPTSARTHALIIPLLNMPALVTGNPTAGPGAAQFGAPIVLPLGGRGIRSIDRTATGEYLVTAGPADTVSTPPAAPLDFRVFTWSGYPLAAPVELTTSFAATESPEACLPPAGPIVASSVAQFINDDGGSTCWRSMSCPVGVPVDPLDVPRVPRSSADVRFSRGPSPCPAHDRVTFAIENPREQAVELTIQDVEGRRVATLWSGVLGEGRHDFTWSGAVGAPGLPRAGIYWVRLRAGAVGETRSFSWLR